MIKYKGKKRLKPIELGVSIAPCTMKYEFIFTEESKYLTTQEPIAVEKLWGFTFGHIHKNSIRLGWNYNGEKDEFNLYSYIYKNKERIIDYICSVRVNDIVVVKIVIFEETCKYILTVVNKETNQTINYTKEYSFTFKGLALHTNAYTEDIPKVEILSTEPKSKTYNKLFHMFGKYNYMILIAISFLLGLSLINANDAVRIIIASFIVTPVIILSMYKAIKELVLNKY